MVACSWGGRQSWNVRIWNLGPPILGLWITREEQLGVVTILAVHFDNLISWSGL